MEKSTTYEPDYAGIGPSDGSSTVENATSSRSR